ncbi:hypothetical protein CIPAW_01G087000 [Carya illinoinensis]|uniref:Protein FAR1-RELATED SEQUENCE n=1 Tax=Carya illinoinensis TaxID=32201 RepID=A0A8T1RMC3_CARIL|nr:hypothetical protein CIPAW_01G087000 [Carya illinoinensis]
MSTSRDHVEILDSSNSSADKVEINQKDGEVDVDKNIPEEGHTMSSSYVEPYVGLEFDDVEDALSCYKAFSRRAGISIRTNHTVLSSMEKSLIGVEYVCSIEGFRWYNLKLIERARPKAPETKCECKVMMTIKKNGSKWVVSKFVLQHNHELLTPRSTSLLCGHRWVTPTQKNLIHTLNESAIPTRKIMSILSKEHDGNYNIGCIPKDIHNYLGNGRKQLLEEGDAQKLYEYFLGSKRNNLGFVYLIQVDVDGSMGNCFWADGKSQAAYQYFGDVVTFDATYLTNRYKMPFVPFTGINYHHQSVMFGCALLINETAESYTWLLKTWLEAMLGRAPSTIITDDDKQWLRPSWRKVDAHLLEIYVLCLNVHNSSESMNMFFKDYVHSSTIINEFIHQYEKALNARYLSEKLKDVMTKTSRPIVKTCLSIEEAVANLYTRKSFLIFQEELFTSQQFNSYKTRKEDGREIYLVAILG